MLDVQIYQIYDFWSSRLVLSRFCNYFLLNFPKKLVRNNGRLCYLHDLLFFPVYLSNFISYGRTLINMGLHNFGLNNWLVRRFLNLRPK